MIVIDIGVVVRFSLPVYSAPEGSKHLLLTMLTEGRHSTNMTVRVLSLTYDDYLALGESLPDDFPEVPAFNPKRPNRANSEQQIDLIHI